MVEWGTRHPGSSRFGTTTKIKLSITIWQAPSNCYPENRRRKCSPAWQPIFDNLCASRELAAVGGFTRPTRRRATGKPDNQSVTIGDALKSANSA
jgi:hypothetical protein